MDITVKNEPSKHQESELYGISYEIRLVAAAAFNVQKLLESYFYTQDTLTGDVEQIFLIFMKRLSTFYVLARIVRCTEIPKSKFSPGIPAEWNIGSSWIITLYGKGSWYAKIYL